MHLSLPPSLINPSPSTQAVLAHCPLCEQISNNEASVPDTESLKSLLGQGIATWVTLSIPFENFFHGLTDAGLLCKFQDELLGVLSICLSAPRTVASVLLPEKSWPGRKYRLGRKFDSSKIMLSLLLIYLTKPVPKAWGVPPRGAIRYAAIFCC